MDSRSDILNLIATKGTAAVRVFEKTRAVFDEVRIVLGELEQDLKGKLRGADPRVPIDFNDKGRMEMQFTFADDVLVFVMHTNVFTFDPSHGVMKSSYVKEDPMRSFCGMIYVYNFLYESVRYNRRDDYGILVARMFVNAEGHFIVEGKRQIGLLFNDFARDTVSRENITRLVEALMVFVLEIDMKVPPFDSMEQTTLQNIIDSSSQTGIISGKRFGFVLPGADESS